MDILMFARQVKIQQVLSDCAPQDAFWFCTGVIVRNLTELADTIEGLSEWSFVYHCNEKNRDFSKWINEVMGDPYLASDIKKENDKKRIVDLIRKRVDELSKL